MTNKTITVRIGIVILFLLGAAFLLRIAVSGNRSIEDTLDTIVLSAKNEDWEAATQQSLNLIELWDQQKYIFMLNYAEVDFSNIGTSLARIRSASEIKELSNVVAECAAAKSILDNMKQIVPEP